MNTSAVATSVPTVTGINPSSGPAGTVVTITGTGFTGATSVGFGAVGLASVIPVSDTQIKVASPVGNVGTVDVTVTTPAGTSPTNAADQFNYVATPAVPVVTGINPSSGPGGTAVTITGTGFAGATSVGFGVAGLASVMSVTDAQLRAVSPVGNVGTVDVTVTTPNGTSALSAADQFTYAAPVPSSPVTPAWGGASAPGATTGLAGNIGTGTGGNTGTSYYVDPGLSSQLVGSIVNILQSATSPDALEAQNMILRRLALQGDVIGSRIPPPRNISEIGGYMNLLASLKQPEMRAQALAGILGVAGSTQPLGWVSNNQPLAFIALANDRPPGPAQATLSLTFVVRSDFSGALQAVLNALHQQGCSLPISGQPVLTLPPAVPGVLPPADVLPFLGRTLDLAVAAALVNPQTDPLALVRSQGSSDLFQIASRVLTSGAVPVASANFDVLQCNASSCSVVAVANGQYVPVAPILATAGFYSASPQPQPTSLTSTSWAHFTNITGLVPGVTKLGDELSLVYNWGTVNHSVFASALHWVWNGVKFT